MHTTEPLPPPLVWVRVKATGHIGYVDPQPLPGGMVRVVFEHDIDGAFWPTELEEVWKT